MKHVCIKQFLPQKFLFLFLSYLEHILGIVYAVCISWLWCVTVFRSVLTLPVNCVLNILFYIEFTFCAECFGYFSNFVLVGTRSLITLRKIVRMFTILSSCAKVRWTHSIRWTCGTCLCTFWLLNLSLRLRISQILLSVRLISVDQSLLSLA